MKSIKRKDQKQNSIKQNGLTTNYYELLKAFVYGIEKNPIKIPAQVKEQMMVAFLDKLLHEVLKTNPADGTSTNTTQDL